MWNCYSCDPLYIRIAISVYNLWRPGFGILNMLTSLLFLYQLKSSVVSKQMHVKTRVVNYTIILELVFNTIPSVVTFVLVVSIDSN